MTKWDERFLELAELVSTWSRDPSTKCGAVIVRPDKTIASIGFNGFPMTMHDSKKAYSNREEKYSRIVHAEVNALIFAKENAKGYTLYTYPCIPCDRCVVLMIQSGIKRIVSIKPTKDMESRWGTMFIRTRKYCKECNVDLVEE